MHEELQKIQKKLEDILLIAPNEEECTEEENELFSDMANLANSIKIYLYK